MSYAKFSLYICSVILIAGFFSGCQKENNFIKIADPQPNDTLYQYDHKIYYFDKSDTFKYAYLLMATNENVTGKFINDTSLIIKPLQQGNFTIEIVTVDSHYNTIRKQKIELKSYKNPYFKEKWKNQLGLNDKPGIKSRKGRDAYSYMQRYSAYGKDLPPFKLRDAQGKLYSKKDLKGKVTMINSWYYNCLPCMHELPALRKVAHQWIGNKNVNLFGFFRSSLGYKNDTTLIQDNSYRGPEKGWEGTMIISPHPFHQLGEAEPYLHSNNFIGYPTNMIVDQDGKIRWIQSVGMDRIDYLAHQANYTIKQLLEDN